MMEVMTMSVNRIVFTSSSIVFFSDLSHNETSLIIQGVFQVRMPVNDSSSIRKLRIVYE